MAGQFVPVKINAEKEGGPALAKQFKVRGFPTVVFADAATGEVCGKIVGYRPADGYGEELTRIAQEQKDFPVLLQQIKDNPKDAAAIVKVLAIYCKRGNTERALALVLDLEKLDPENKTGELTKAYLAVGDTCQQGGDYAMAIEYFTKVAEKSQSPEEVAKAHLNIAICYLMQRKNKEALPELEKAAAVKDAPEAVTKRAQQILEIVKKQTK